MTEPTTADRFYAIFRGRKDAYGTWEGGCIREPLTPMHFVRHLRSDDPKDWIGVYPLGNSKCSWGCIDIDGKDFPDKTGYADGLWDWDAMADLAYKLCKLLEVKEVYAFTERTRNGIHVWVFPEDNLVSAATMRRALMAACKAADYNPKEVNPKQESLPANKLGNYVRLPYYGALTDMHEGGWQTDRHFFDWDDPDGCHPHGIGSYLGLETFLDVVRFTSTEALEDCAKLWTPPVKQYSVDPTLGLDAESTVRSLNGLGYTIWKDGPLPGSDRSSTLSHLGHLCQESGLTAQQAYTVVASADLRWGKFQPEGRPDAEEQLTAIVERAYAS